MSLFVMAAGLAILMASFGKLDVATANLVAGAGLTLFGIGKLVHKLGMCPMCKC